MHVFMSSKNQTQHCTKNLMTAVKSEAIRGKVWGWWCYCLQTWMTFHQGSVNFVLYQRILQENIHPSICQMKLHPVPECVIQ